MKRIVILFLFIFPLLINAVSADGGSTALDKFSRANELYSNGDYSKAVELYTEIEDNGYISPELYYNMGNAYFKMREIAPAILYYERAKRLAPQDEDIRFNLKIAELRTVDKIEPVPKFFLTKWIDTLISQYNSSGWAAIAVILSWLTFGSLAIFYFLGSSFFKKFFFAIGILFFVLTITSFIFAYQKYEIETSDDSAIIFSPSVYVKSSPDKSGKNLFILHEGTKVEIRDEVGEWKKIRLADGNIGWLPADAVEII